MFGFALHITSRLTHLPNHNIQGDRRTMSEYYQPDKFNPEDARPNSMDAYKLPSVVNGVRIPRKAPSNQCVGKLKDNKEHAN